MATKKQITQVMKSAINEAASYPLNMKPPTLEDMYEHALGVKLGEATKAQMRKGLLEAQARRDDFFKQLENIEPIPIRIAKAIQATQSENGDSCKPKKQMAKHDTPTSRGAAIRQSNYPADICAIDEAVDALHRVTATVNTGTASDIRRVFFIDVADWRKIHDVLCGASLRARGFNDFPNANDVWDAWARFDSAWYDLIVGMMNRFYTETNIIASAKKGVEEFFADIDMERDIWEWQPQSLDEHYKAIRLHVANLECATANATIEIAKCENAKPAAYTQTTPQSKGASAATNTGKQGTRPRSPAIAMAKSMQDFIYKRWEEFKTEDLDEELRRAGGKRTYEEFLKKHGTDKRDGTNQSILDALGGDMKKAANVLARVIRNCNRRK